jgi:tetratricopeptide (TPR) repeat protein
MGAKMQRLMIGLILMTVLVPRAHAQDDNTERARIHLRAAIAHYELTRYEDAVREMETAYQIKPLPDLQYDLAQCYERLGRYEDAAKAYETYLSGNPSAFDRKLVVARIENLRERAKAVAAGAQAPPLPPATEKVVFKTIVVYKDRAAPGRGVRYTAVGVGVLGLAALGTGIAFSVLAHQAADRVTHGGNVLSPPPFNGTPRETQQSGKSYPIIAGVSYGVAGLCALGGVGLYLLSRKIDKEAPRYSLAPAFSPTSAGVSFSGVL